MFWKNQKAVEGWEWDAHEPNERRMHVLDMGDSPAGPEGTDWSKRCMGHYSYSHQN